MPDDDIWRSLCGLLGCRCASCEDQARRYVSLQLDDKLALVSSVFISYDEDRVGGVGPSGAALHDLLGASSAAAFPNFLSILQGKVWSGAFRHQQHDAPPIWVEILALPRFGPHGAAPIGLQLSIEEKSRQYTQREQQAALNERLSIIHQYAADSIFSIDERGMIESVNPAAEALFGWREVELLGRPITMLMPPSEAAAHQSYIDRYLDTGVSGIVNVGPRPLQALRKDGSLVAIELSVAEAHLGDRAVFIGVCRSLAKRSDAGRAEAVARV